MITIWVVIHFKYFCFISKSIYCNAYCKYYNLIKNLKDIFNSKK